MEAATIAAARYAVAGRPSCKRLRLIKTSVTACDAMKCAGIIEGPRAGKKKLREALERAKKKR